MNRDHRQRTILQSRTALAFVACLLIGACDSNDKKSQATGADTKNDAGKQHSDAGNSDSQHADASMATDDTDASAAADASTPDAGSTEPMMPDAAMPPATDAGQSADKSLYAMAILVFNPDNSSNTYVSIFDSLDVKDIDLSKAREFAGSTDIATYDGKLFVADGEKPTVQRFSVGDDGKLSDEGTVSFATLGLDTAALRDNVFINSSKAYLNTGASFAMWNPSNMELLGELKVPAVEADRNGMTLDGSTSVVRGDRLYKTYYWEDWSSYTFSKEQYVGTFDIKNDKLISVVAEDRCPALGAAGQQDEDGNIYFSNWFYNTPGTLLSGAPHSCALRIPKGSDAIDPNWSLRFDQIDGGHEGAQLSYIAKGQAIFAALHQEDIKITKDTAPYDVVSSVNWEAWTVDLKDTTTAKPVDGMDRGTATQTVFTLDGRTFVLLPGMDWNTTQVYELLPDAKSRLAFSIKGWSRAFVKIK